MVGNDGFVSRSELFNEIRNRLATTEKTLLVSIDGPAGAGKTTLAKDLLDEFTNADVIHMDDLYRGWALTLGPNLTREKSEEHTSELQSH